MVELGAGERETVDLTRLVLEQISRPLLSVSMPKGWTQLHYFSLPPPSLDLFPPSPLLAIVIVGHRNSVWPDFFYISSSRKAVVAFNLCLEPG